MESLNHIPVPALSFHPAYPAPMHVAVEARVMRSFAQRLLGVFDPRSEGPLLFPGCRGLQSFGATESIWVVWLDADHQPVASSWLHPNGWMARPPGAMHALEMPLSSLEESVCETLH